MNDAPNEILFAGLIVALIVFGGIDGYLAFGMVHGDQKDFGTFYEGARAFLAGREMYVSGTYLGNLNPPHVFLLLLPVAALPASFAWGVWGVASLVGLVASLRLIAREVRVVMTPWRVWIAAVAVVSSAATGAVIGVGQISWLLMWPVTLAWRAARRDRWTLAGALIGGLISMKPFLLLFLPYLLLRRRWRAVLSAIVAASLSIGVGLAIFGVEAYAGWLRALNQVSWSWLPMNASVMGVLSRNLSEVAPAPFVDAPQLVTPLWVAAVVIIGGVTAASFWLGEPASGEDNRFALALTAALLMSPLGWLYYAWFPLGPIIAASVPWWSIGGLRRQLLLVAIAASFWPVLLATALQSFVWATVTLGSMYFWGLLAIWLALIVDSFSGVARPFSKGAGGLDVSGLATS